MREELKFADRLKLKSLIDGALDALYPEAERIGHQVGEALSLQKETLKSQIRGLQVVAGAATRTSELKNHIKNQTGKDRLKNTDRQTWARRGDAARLEDKGGERASDADRNGGRPAEGEMLGSRLLAFIERLAALALPIAQTLKQGEDETRERAREIELELQRGAIHTVVAAALYGDVKGAS